MGYTFTIKIWTLVSYELFDDEKHDKHYDNVEFWRGDSFFKMIIKMIEAKRTKSGCITLEWRP